MVLTRETRELLTFETKVNGDSKNTNEKAVLPWLGCWVLSRRLRVIFVLPRLLYIVGPAQKLFFLAVHYLNSFVHIAQQAGQAVVPGRLSLSLCLCC